MARTIEQIQTSLLTEKANVTELAGLTSSSKTAIWRLMIYIMSFAIYAFEVILDKHYSYVKKKLT